MDQLNPTYERKWKMENIEAGSHLFEEGK